MTGTDPVGDRTVSPPVLATTPAGLRIVDTRDRTFRVLDPQASSMQLAGGRLFAGPGLVAYSRRGRELYRLFAGETVGRVAAIGGRGYATVGGRTASFDLATGAPGPTVARPLWELLLGDAAPLSG